MIIQNLPSGIGTSRWGVKIELTIPRYIELVRAVRIWPPHMHLIIKPGAVWMKVYFHFFEDLIVRCLDEQLNTRHFLRFPRLKDVEEYSCNVCVEESAPTVATITTKKDDSKFHTDKGLALYESIRCCSMEMDPFLDLLLACPDSHAQMMQ